MPARNVRWRLNLVVANVQITGLRTAATAGKRLDRSSRRSLGGGSGSRGGGGGGDQRLGAGPTTNRRPTASSLSPASGNSSKEALLLLYVLTKVVFLDKSKIALFALEITSRRLQHF